MRRTREHEVFANALTTLAAAGWKLYSARWQRRRNRHLGGRVWQIAAEIGVFGAQPPMRAVASLMFLRARTLVSERRALMKDGRFAEIVASIQTNGYRAYKDESGDWPRLFKQLSPTRHSLRAERERLDGILGAAVGYETVVGATTRGPSAAVHEFRAALEWRPSGAAWSMPGSPVVISGLGTVGVTMHLIQRDRESMIMGRELRAEANVMITPERRRGRAAFNRLAAVLRQAGFKGGPLTKTGEIDLIGLFSKRRFGRGGLEAARLRLEALAEDLRALA